jgi:integrase
VLTPVHGGCEVVRLPAVGLPCRERRLEADAFEQYIKRIGRQADVERLRPRLLRHTFACMYLLRYRDSIALKSLPGHTTLQMTNHYRAAVQHPDVSNPG